MLRHRSRIRSLTGRLLLPKQAADFRRASTPRLQLSLQKALIRLTPGYPERLGFEQP